MRAVLVSILAIVVAAVLIAAVGLLTPPRAGPAPSPPGAASPQAAVQPRIVVLSPGLADLVRSMGLSPLVVGRHAFDAWSNRSLPVCGDQAGLNYESLLQVRPTHVLLEWGQRELPARLSELAAAHNWHVRSFSLLSLDDIVLAAYEIGQMLGRLPGAGASAEAAAAVRGTFERAFADHPGAERAGRILLLYGTSPPTVLGPGSFHHQILERLGGVPAITEGKPFITLDAEDVLRLKPDGIVLIMPRPAGSPPFATPRDAATLHQRLGALAKLDIPAIVNGRVALIDDETAALPGPGLTRVGVQLGEILDSWAK